MRYPLLRKDLLRHRAVVIIIQLWIPIDTIVIDIRVGNWLRQLIDLIPIAEFDLHSGSVEPVVDPPNSLSESFVSSPTAVQADVPWRHTFGNCITIVYTILQFSS